jgi:NADPH:quinone reductase-like Zn-dependent oxidoreductase
MTVEIPDSALELRSLVTSQGQLELSLVDVPVPTPAANEVLVRIEASPINPSDLGVLVATADMDSATVAGTSERPVVTAPLIEGTLRGLASRIDVSLPVGNEGAGTVVAAGSSPDAQALIGKTVGVVGGGMYTQYRLVDAASCLVLPDGTSASDGASNFVNPMTALGMVETMRREGHSGLVHTAAASNLGQMLVKLCLKDGVPLVNIVRKPEQEELLRSLGAVYVCNSASSSFSTDLTEALKATSATLAFDATGGGPLANQILSAMERAAPGDDGTGLLPVRLVRPQAGVHLRCARSPPRHPRQGLRVGMGGRRVAGLVLPRERRPGDLGPASLSRSRRTHHDVRELLQPRGVVGGHAAPRRIQVLRQAGDGREVPPDAERRLS